MFTTYLLTTDNFLTTCREQTELNQTFLCVADLRETRECAAVMKVSILVERRQSAKKELNENRKALHKLARALQKKVAETEKSFRKFGSYDFLVQEVGGVLVNEPIAPRNALDFLFEDQTDPRKQCQKTS